MRVRQRTRDRIHHFDGRRRDLDRCRETNAHAPGVRLMHQLGYDRLQDDREPQRGRDSGCLLGVCRRHGFGHGNPVRGEQLQRFELS